MLRNLGGYQMNIMSLNNLELSIGILIRKIRNNRKLSQENLAELCNLHRNYIGCIERGEKNITVKNLAKILAALGMSLEDFFTMLASQ